MSRVLRSVEGKVKRKKYRRILAGVFVLGIFAAVWGVGWLSSRPVLLISHIQTEGNQKISSEEIAQETLAMLSGKYVFLFPKAHIFWYPEGELRTHFLEKYPRVKDISFSRPSFFSRDFHTIVARVVEREEKAMWCGDVLGTPPCYFLDDAGVVFAPAEMSENFLLYANMQKEERGEEGEREGEEGGEERGGEKKEIATVTAVAVGEPFLPPETFRALGDFADALKKNGFLPKKILLGEERYAEMFLGVGVLGGGGREWKIIFRTDQDFTQLEKNLLTLAHSEKLAALMRGAGVDSTENFKPLEYIDLRFGNKVYYR